MYVWFFLPGWVCCWSFSISASYILLYWYSMTQYVRNIVGMFTTVNFILVSPFYIYVLHVWPRITDQIIVLLLRSLQSKWTIFQSGLFEILPYTIYLFLLCLIMNSSLSWVPWIICLWKLLALVFVCWRYF